MNGVADLPAIVRDAIDPALKLLPASMDSKGARTMLLSIGLQESGFRVRYQQLQNGRKGPARGYWQFERGSPTLGGGVWGIYKHPQSKLLFHKVCDARGLIDNPALVWGMLEFDDVLAACMARLLLWTDPLPLPNTSDTWGAWRCYERNWRPGKPHPDRWNDNHAKAVAALL